MEFGALDERIGRGLENAGIGVIFFGGVIASAQFTIRTPRAVPFDESYTHDWRPLGAPSLVNESSL